jgi:hypothetical protein
MDMGGKQLPPVSAGCFAIEDKTVTRPLLVRDFANG